MFDLYVLIVIKNLRQYLYFSFWHILFHRVYAAYPSSISRILHLSIFSLITRFRLNTFKKNATKLMFVYFIAPILGACNIQFHDNIGNVKFDYLVRVMFKRNCKRSLFFSFLEGGIVNIQFLKNLLSDAFSISQ